MPFLSTKFFSSVGGGGVGGGGGAGGVVVVGLVVEVANGLGVEVGSGGVGVFRSGGGGGVVVVVGGDTTAVGKSGAGGGAGGGGGGGAIGVVLGSGACGTTSRRMPGATGNGPAPRAGGISAAAGVVLGALICGLAVATGAGTLGTLVVAGVDMAGLAPGFGAVVAGLVPGVLAGRPEFTGLVGLAGGGLVVPTNGLGFVPGEPKLGNGCPEPLTATGGAGLTGVRLEGVPAGGVLVTPGLVAACTPGGGAGGVKLGAVAVGALGCVLSGEKGFNATRCRLPGLA